MKSPVWVLGQAILIIHDHPITRSPGTAVLRVSEEHFAEWLCGLMAPLEG